MKYLLLFSLLLMFASLAGLPKSRPAVVELTTQDEVATNNADEVGLCSKYSWTCCYRGWKLRSSNEKC